MVAEASLAAGQAVDAVGTAHAHAERAAGAAGRDGRRPQGRIPTTTASGRPWWATLEDGPRRDVHRTLAGVIDAAGAAPDGWLDGVERTDETARRRPCRGCTTWPTTSTPPAKRKAMTYSLLAAEQARRQSALEVAVNNYALAARNAEEGDGAGPLPHRRGECQGAHAAGAVRRGPPAIFRGHGPRPRRPPQGPRRGTPGRGRIQTGQDR